MSYINPEWIENIHIERVLSSTDFDITDCQARCDNEMELQSLMVSVGATDIPTDILTGFTTSPILIKYGIDYLTYTIARAIRESNDDNDVYDGIMEDYYNSAQATQSTFTNELILNIDKDPLPASSFIKQIPIF